MREVVVVLDGPETASALDWALEEARRRRVPLLVVMLPREPGPRGVLSDGAVRLIASCAESGVDARCIEADGDWVAVSSALDPSMVVIEPSLLVAPGDRRGLVSLPVHLGAPLVVVPSMHEPERTRALVEPSPGDAWVVDLDGVVWLAGEPIQRVGEAIARLRDGGVSVYFATNNSAPRIATLLERLRGAGIDATEASLITASQAAAMLVEPGERVFMVGAEGLREALLARGADVVDEGVADVVVVGWDTRFTFETLGAAAQRVRDGARLIGTNDDPSHPTRGGLLPGAGAVLGAVAIASGVDAVVAGKPYEPMTRLVAERVGRVAGVIGDRASTDGELARRLGAGFGLVLSGVTSPTQIPADSHSVYADLFDLVSTLLD